MTILQQDAIAPDEAAWQAYEVAYAAEMRANRKTNAAFKAWEDAVRTLRADPRTQDVGVMA